MIEEDLRRVRVWKMKEGGLCVFVVGTLGPKSEIESNVVFIVYITFLSLLFMIPCVLWYSFVVLTS